MKSLKKYYKQYYQKNKKKILKQVKRYDQTHKIEKKEYDRKYYLKNKKKILKYYQKHREEKLKYKKKYNQEHKKYYNKYFKKRKKYNINFKLSINLRDRIRKALKQNSKNTSSLKLLGCSIKFLKRHLENQFKKGMDWNNWSLKGWHVDHIKPCASFDLRKPKEQRKCFHYTNLQPLWAKDNMKKGCKIILKKI